MASRRRRCSPGLGLRRLLTELGRRRALCELLWHVRGAVQRRRLRAGSRRWLRRGPLDCAAQWSRLALLPPLRHLEAAQLQMGRSGEGGAVQSERLLGQWQLQCANRRGCRGSARLAGARKHMEYSHAVLARVLMNVRLVGVREHALRWCPIGHRRCLIGHRSPVDLVQSCTVLVAVIVDGYWSGMVSHRTLGSFNASHVSYTSYTGILHPSRLRLGCAQVRQACLSTNHGGILR